MKKNLLVCRRRTSPPTWLSWKPAGNRNRRRVGERRFEGKESRFLHHHGLTVYDQRCWCCLLLSCQSGVSMVKSGQRKNKPTATAHEWMESSWYGLGMTASGPHFDEILEILWLRHAHGSEGIFCTMGIPPRAPQSDPRRHAAQDSAAPFSFGQALRFVHVGHQCSKGKSLA